MKWMNQKRWLALALFCLAPITAFAGPGKSKPKDHHQRPTDIRKVSVPEGDSSLVYVLGAGFTCLGAILVRSRNAESKES